MHNKRIRYLWIALIVWGLCGVVGFFDEDRDTIGLMPLGIKCALAQQGKPAVTKPSQPKPAKNVGKEKLLKTINAALEQIEKSHAEELNYNLLLQGALHGMIKTIDKKGQVLSASDTDTKQKETPLEAKIVNPDSEAVLSKLKRILGSNRRKLSDSEKTGQTVRNAYKILGEDDAALDKIAEALDIPKDISRNINAYSTFTERFQFGYIRLGSLTEKTPSELENALKRFEQEKVRAVILDLRNNPGGTLKTAVAVADKFISDGPIVTVKEFNVKAITHQANKEGTRASFPLIVIINSDTAAEAEVIAGALKERRAIIIGAKSAGKGGFQRDLPIEGSNLKLRLVAGDYQLPSGHDFNGKGIEPNIAITEGVIGGPSASDAYVRRAKQILKGILKLKVKR